MDILGLWVHTQHVDRLADLFHQGGIVGGLAQGLGFPVIPEGDGLQGGLAGGALVPGFKLGCRRTLGCLGWELNVVVVPVIRGKP